MSPSLQVPTEIVLHRVNTRERLRRIPAEFGLEIDLRAEGSALILNHDPFKGGERFSDWLEDYHHGLLVLNIKEAGIEAEALRLATAAGARRLFLLDVEFPYIYRATREGESRLAMRYSEDEDIGTVLRYQGRADWVWIDTNTRLPLDEKSVGQLAGFQTCLVCPERWGRPQDILPYRRRLQALGFQPSAVMTSEACVPQWRAPL